MKKLLSLLTMVLLLGATACDKYLDVLPDNRAEIDSEAKVGKLLVSAYPSIGHAYVTEMISDNIDDYLGESSSTNTLFQTEVAQWKDVRETNNESPYSVWNAHYLAIANANQAIESMQAMGITETLKPYYGEALLARAYNHFILVNMFCWHYNKTTSSTDLGIPYMEHSETDLDPKYERGTVADVYELIEKDLVEGLPLITDNYDVPKYHFNVNAAYAFASRFYLYYEKYDKVIQCANKVLGTNPANMMKDWSTLSTKPFDPGIYAADYVNASYKSNLLLVPAVSVIGVMFLNYSNYKRFAHTQMKNKYETFAAPAPWGIATDDNASNFYYVYVRRYGSTGGASNYAIMPKLPYMFEYTDPVARTGYPHTVFPLLQAEEVLLNRAEAYIFQGKYDEAVSDMVVWQRSRLKATTTTLTRTVIDNFYNGINYFQPKSPTTKYRLNPLMSAPVQAGEMENLIHCLLHIRRIHTMHEGLRWFDTKRYGIVTHRRLFDLSASILSCVVYDSLTVNDPRRAIQIPYDIVAAGLTPNPR